MNEQQVNDKLIFSILNFIQHADDMDERRFVLIVAEKTIQDYVLSMERFGLFEKWWENEFLLKEAKVFIKDPKPGMFSTLKQEVFGQFDGRLYTLYFHLRCEAKNYYKSITKKKMSYLVNNSSLTHVKLEKYNREKNQNEEVFNEEYKPQMTNLFLPKGGIIQ